MTPRASEEGHTLHVLQHTAWARLQRTGGYNGGSSFTPVKHAGAKQLDSDNWTRLAQALTEVACCLFSSFTQSHRQPIGSTTQLGTTSWEAGVKTDDHLRPMSIKEC